VRSPLMPGALPGRFPHAHSKARHCAAQAETKKVQTIALSALPTVNSSVCFCIEKMLGSNGAGKKQADRLLSNSRLRQAYRSMES
jgi:hypothetical protein